MARKAGNQEERRRPAASVQPDLMTVTRPELLAGASDAAFRAMIHSLMSYARHIETIRDGFGKVAGLSGVQYEVLMSTYRLQGEGGVTVSELAKWLHLSGAFVTIETGKLTARGLLEKTTDSRDRRRVRVRLTAAGGKTLASLAPRQRQVNDVLFASLSPRDFQALGRILAGLLPCGERAAHLMDFILKEAGTAPFAAIWRRAGDED
ncbi:MAG: MarR family winged helix-turn-helix transcriptional regulator [Candidatus Binataceae bacterium]